MVGPYSHNERLEGQKRYKLDQEPHNATVEQFIERGGETLGCKIGRRVPGEVRRSAAGRVLRGMEHDLPLSCPSLHLAKGTPNTISNKKRELFTALAHTKCRKGPITSCCTERDRIKERWKGEEKRGGKGKEEIGREG